MKPFIFLSSLGLVLLLGSATPVSAQRLTETAITAERLKRHVYFLADDALQGRNAGYLGEKKAAVYVAQQFEQIGLHPLLVDSTGQATYVQPFAFVPRRAPAPGSTEVPPQPAPMQAVNVIGYIKSDHPTLKDDIVMIVAHHDGQGTTHQTDPGRLPVGERQRAQSDQIWNSADDNASGVAALIEMARVLAGQPEKLGRSLLFVSFSAEEHGLYGYQWLTDATLPRSGGGGAEYFALHPPLALDRIAAVINLEMIGRNPAQAPRLYGAQDDLLIVSANKANQAGPLHVGIDPTVQDCCDHIVFHRQGMPAVLFGVPGDRTHYHQAHDEAEQLDYDRMREITYWLAAYTINLSTYSR